MSSAPAESSASKGKPSQAPASGLARAFAHGHAALVVYLMAGYPDRAQSLEALREVAAAGADLIELGVPYSDALADGPVIVKAANESMRANEGFGLMESIELAADFLSDSGLDEPPPVALMTYLNPVLRLGPAKVARRMQTAGVGGVIIPDMPPDVAEDWLCEARACNLDTVFLVAPTSTPERLSKAGEMSSGFVYAVSTTGVTGEREELSGEIEGLVERVRAFTTLPVAVGFGVSTPEQAEAVARVADGVIVGSAIVKRQHDPSEMSAFVRVLAGAVHSAS